MQHQGKIANILIAVAVLVSVGVVTGDDYLKEAPSFLKPCNIHGEHDEKCFISAFEHLFTTWRDGIPGLKGISQLDPFHVRKVRFQQTTDVINVQMDLRNVIVEGLSKIKLTKLAISDKDYTFKFGLHLPTMILKNDYKIKGRILFLNLNGQGDMYSKMSDIDYLVVAKTNLVKRGDEYFFDIVSINTDITHLGTFQIQLNNLFGGNRALEESANQLFNESWKDLFGLMRPAIGQTLDAVIYERYKKIFSYVPARYFLRDLP